jgi:hypothetical protein
MSKENLNRFCELVLADLELQKHLKNLTERDEFISKVIALSAASGLEISRKEIEERMRENRRLWHERWM